MNIGETSSFEKAAGEQDVNAGTFRAMVQHFDGKLGAFAYLMAILLYIPCVAAMSAIFREVGRKWALFAIGWTTFLAYGASVGVYQAGTFSAHPRQSMLWIIALLLVFVAILGIMRHYGGRKHGKRSDIVGAAS